MNGRGFCQEEETCDEKSKATEDTEAGAKHAAALEGTHSGKV